MSKENFVKYLENSIKKNWEGTAFSDYEGDSLTYKETAAQIKHFHCIFEQCKIQKGDKIALIGKNSTNWAVIYLSVVSYGAVVVPLLSDFRPKDVHHLVNHSDSVLLFAADSNMKELDFQEMEKLNGIFSLTDFSIKFERGSCLSKAQSKAKKTQKKNKTELTSENFSLPENSNDSLLGILYTSGTSGFSKGVMLKHSSLAANVWYATTYLPLESGDAILSFLPLAHAFGCAFEFLYPFSEGCHITFLSKIPSPQIIIKAFKKVKPRLILCVPLIIEKIYRKQIKPALDKPVMKVMLKIPGLKNKVYSKVKTKLNDVFGGNFHEIVIGGAALNGEVEQFLRKINFAFTVGYGMTECGPLMSYSNWKNFRPSYSGKVVDTLEIKIEADEPGKKIGEICVKGVNVMTGYYKNEAATASTIDKDGWLHTGDLGELDKDNFVAIKGRSKSMILGPSGQNIYPEEIEAILNNMPLVQESLIIEKEGKLHAVVYPDQELIKQQNLSKEDVRQTLLTNQKHLNKELPKHMTISRTEIIDKEFEKTPKKSIKRFMYTVPNYEVHKIN